MLEVVAQSHEIYLSLIAPLAAVGLVYVKFTGRFAKGQALPLCNWWNLANLIKNKTDSGSQDYCCC